MPNENIIINNFSIESQNEIPLFKRNYSDNYQVKNKN
jgi:hypothetical protein